MNIWYAIAASLVALVGWGYFSRFLYKASGVWMRSIAGVALVTQSLVLALIFTFIATNLWAIVFTGSLNWPGRQVVGSILFTLLAATKIMIWTAFEKAQRNKD